MGFKGGKWNPDRVASEYATRDIWLGARILKMYTACSCLKTTVLETRVGIFFSARELIEKACLMWLQDVCSIGVSRKARRSMINGCFHCYLSIGRDAQLPSRILFRGGFQF